MYINHLSDTDTELKMLARCSRILKIFIKFNTTLQSSVPVERQIKVSRNRLSNWLDVWETFAIKANYGGLF